MSLAVKDLLFYLSSQIHHGKQITVPDNMHHHTDLYALRIPLANKKGSEIHYFYHTQLGKMSKTTNFDMI